MINTIRNNLSSVFFILILLALIATTTFTYLQFRYLLESNKWVAHTHKVIETNEELLVAVLNANRLERDYFYSGDLASLEKENIVLQSIFPYLVTIRELTSDNPNQQKLLLTLESLLRDFTSSLRDYITTYQQQNHIRAQNLIHSQEHEDRVELIKQTINTMNQNEAVLLKSRTDDFSHFTMSTNLSFATYSTLSYILIILAFYILYLKEKKHTQKQIENNRILLDQNKKIIEAQQLKNDFLENMSHEFMTPLNGIIGFIEVILDEKAGAISPIQKEYLNDSLGSARHLFELITDMLDLYQIEKNTIRFNPELCNLNELVKEVHKDLHSMVEKKRIDIDTKIDKTIEHVIIDPAKFKKVIYNYLSNAIKHSNIHGKISIRIHPEQVGTLKISVKDHGIGIREEDIDKLFMAFPQINSARGNSIHGAGLGLALTRRIVEAQDGKVGVKSTFKKGSEFFAILPYQIK